MLRLVCKRGGGLFMSIFFLTHGPRAVTYGGGGGGGCIDVVLVLFPSSVVCSASFTSWSNSKMLRAFKFFASINGSA